MKECRNQHTKGYTKAEILEAKRHRAACRIAAKRLRDQIKFQREEIKRIKADWRRLIAESKKPLKEFIEYAREFREKQAKSR